jgi:hypothetical protein
MTVICRIVRAIAGESLVGMGATDLLRAGPPPRRGRPRRVQPPGSPPCRSTVCASGSDNRGNTLRSTLTTLVVAAQSGGRTRPEPDQGVAHWRSQSVNTRASGTVALSDQREARQQIFLLGARKSPRRRLDGQERTLPGAMHTSLKGGRRAPTANLPVSLSANASMQQCRCKRVARAESTPTQPSAPISCETSHGRC